MSPTLCEPPLVRYLGTQEYPDWQDFDQLFYFCVAVIFALTAVHK